VSALRRCVEPRVQSGADRVQGFGVLRNRFAQRKQEGGKFERRFIDVECSVDAECSTDAEHSAGVEPSVDVEQRRFRGLDIVSAGAWSVWFLVACCIAAVVLAIIAVVNIAISGLGVMRHVKSVSPDELLLIKIDMAREAGARIEGSLESIETLLPRARAALTQINAAIRTIAAIVPPS
jgi:hypothetical protein